MNETVLERSPPSDEGTKPKYAAQSRCMAHLMHREEEARRAFGGRIGTARRQFEFARESVFSQSATGVTGRDGTRGVRVTGRVEVGLEEWKKICVWRILSGRFGLVPAPRPATA